jgi:hypothetical protein
VGADVVDGDDVGVREPRHRPRLAQEPRAAPIARVRRRLEQLDRQLAVELGVVGRVDDAHGAGADAIKDQYRPTAVPRVIAESHPPGSYGLVADIRSHDSA